MSLPIPSRILLVFSVICLAASIGIFRSYGAQIYFAVFHRPADALWSKPAAAYSPPRLPHFEVQSAVKTSQLKDGESQTVTLTVTADSDVDAAVLVWIKSPKNKEVFKSPKDAKKHFVKGVPQTISYDFAPTAAMPKGSYRVSEIIQSTDAQTDYYVNQNFARFTFQ